MKCSSRDSSVGVCESRICTIGDEAPLSCGRVSTVDAGVFNPEGAHCRKFRPQISKFGISYRTFPRESGSGPYADLICRAVVNGRSYGQLRLLITIRSARPQPATPYLSTTGEP